MTANASNETTARLDVAAEIARRYAASPAVAGVLCGGSVGRGHADRWSDLEIGVFWSRPPDDALRGQLVTDLGGSSPRLFGYDEVERTWFDEWWFGGQAGAALLVEVVHLTVDDAGRLLDRLLLPADPDPDPYLLTVAAALAYGRPLAGSVDALTERVRSYPRPLAVAVARRHGQIDHFWRWQMYVERGNPHGLRRHFGAVADALTHVACALNGRWWPGPKWPRWTLADLPVAPPDLADRLAGVDGLAPHAAAAALTELVEETYDLVATHLPEADAERLRAIFHFARDPWPRG